MQLLFIYLFIYVVFIALSSIVLTHDNLYFEFYGDQLAYERIVELIDQQKKWEWLGYVILPFIYLAKFFITSSFLLTGIFIAGYKVTFREIFKVVIQAEFVFLTPMLLKLIWFGFFFRDYTLEDLMGFAPLSLISLLDSSTIRQWFIPLLSSINLFEFAYWGLLSYGIYKLINRSYTSSFGLVAASYGSAWTIWQVFVIFLIINLS
jgi:hypothetical protein